MIQHVAIRNIGDPKRRSNPNKRKIYNNCNAHSYNLTFSRLPQARTSNVYAYIQSKNNHKHETRFNIFPPHQRTRARDTTRVHLEQKARRAFIHTRIYSFERVDFAARQKGKEKRMQEKAGGEEEEERRRRRRKS